VSSHGVPTAELDSLTDAALQALRAFVAVADRSLQGSGTQLTLPQYRTLAALANHGPQTSGGLAELLGVDPSTVTRMCDRLVRLRLLRRDSQLGDRRTINVSLTARGREVVAKVLRRRRSELGGALRAMEPQRRGQLVALLDEFGSALQRQGLVRGSVGWLA
jgi:DNA-binding MarR family transcriptional regulator